jgi:hypothetical protein
MKTLYFSFIFYAASVNTYAQNICSICDKFKNNVVQLTTNFDDGREENGFGTVIAEKDNKLYIVTAKHVIYTLDEKGFVSIDTKTNSVAVKFFSEQGKDYTATLLKLPNTSLDISLLEIQKPKDYSWSKDFYSKAIQKGTKVWFIGRSGKWYIPTGSFIGSVNDVSSDDEILIDINSIQPGTSGAPLISADGMVGLIFEDAAGGAKAYPVDKLIKLITKTWNYEWQMNLNTNITQPEISEQEDKAWTAIMNEKKEKNKMDKLEDYVAKGQGAHIDDAKKMYEGLLWANIGNYKNMTKYVQYFPNGQYINQVEDKVFRSAVNPEYYTDLFPNGRYVEQANKKMAAANSNEENELWAGIKRGFDADIDTYLEKYPDGKYISQIEELVWQRALDNAETAIAFKEQGFEDYVKYFPTGKYKDKAKEMIRKYKQ